MRTAFIPKQTLTFGHRLLRVNLPQSWEYIDQLTPGYCYLCLYEEEYHQKVAFILGQYPCWGDIKSFGGFRETGTFNVVRMKNDVIHVSTDGIGVPARDLTLNDREIVGSPNTIFNKKYIASTWPLVMTYWYVRWFMMNTGYYTTLPSIMISMILISPTWTVMLLCGNIVLPNPVYWCKRLARYKLPIYSSIKAGWPKIFYLAIFCSMLLSADARIGIETDDIIDAIKEVTDIERDLLRDVHPRYMAVFDNNLEPTDLCTHDYEMRGELLDLDMDDKVIIQYLEATCASLRKEGDWHANVKTKFIKDRRFDYGKYSKQTYRQKVQKKVLQQVEDESEALVDAIGIAASATIEQTKSVLAQASQENSKLTSTITDEGFKVVSTANTALAATAKGVNSILDNRAKQIQPLIEDVDKAVTVITDQLPNATTLATGLTNQLKSFKDEVKIDLKPAQVVNSIWDMGNSLIDDATRVGGKLYKQAVNRIDIQMDSLEVTHETEPLTFNDIINAGSAIVNFTITTGEDVAGYIKASYTENNVKRNTANLVEQGPWLMETVGTSIGKLPDGVIKGSGISEAVTGFIKNLREATIGPADTPEQHEKRMELNHAVQLERAKTKGTILSLFRGWNSGSSIEKKKRK